MAAPAPLYIVMVNHGDIERFHLGNDVITPTELDTWLDKLEGDLATDKPEALDKKRILLLGYSYSGSFINTLSKKGRIIVTSAAKDEESYKGPNEPDNIRSGEFFIEELFKEIGRGYSLKESFQKATDRTEDFTVRGGSSTKTDNKYFDNSVQHPLMDDDGDKVGTNEITEGSDDGKEAANIIVGSGETYTTDGINPADITDVTATQHLGASATSAAMWATVNDKSRVDDIWFEVRSPTTELSVVGSGVTEQLELDFPRTFLIYNSSTKRYEADYADFDSSGKWEVYYFVKDVLTKEISPMVRSVVYKDKTGNNPPGAFDLESPDNESKEQTALIFVWEGSTDPDGVDVTYNLLIATDNRFDDIVYKEEEITTTATIVDKDVVLENGDVGLSDLTTYYWEGQAVDAYGSVTDSTRTRSFSTDNTGGIAGGFIEGKIYDDTYFDPIVGAQISTDLGGIGISIVDGHYFLLVPAGTHKVTGKFNKYENTLVPGIGVSSAKVTKLNIPMRGTNPAPDIKANNSDGPVTIGTNGTLSVEISLDARDGEGETGDWWVVVNTPTGELESYDLTPPGAFTPGLMVTHMGALGNLGSTEILNTSGLGAGTYTYYFGIDLNMDGTLDTGGGLFFYDSVGVTVKTVPSPQIYANGTGGAVTISAGEPLAISVSLASGSYSGTDADWWVVADTPSGWQYYNLATGTFTSGLLVTYQSALFNLGSTVIFKTSGLGAGTYTFLFRG